jgi:threonine/homoserine/homoserine lactone efflux protein
MTLSSLLLFAAVYFAAVASPGPGIAALVARVLGQGLVGVAPFIAGFLVGDVIWLLAAATGMALVAKAFAGVFVALKVAGAAYLLYLAWKMASAPSPSSFEEAAPLSSRGWRAFLGSLSLTLGNPKVMVFFLSIMPLVVDIRTLTPAALAELAAVSAVVLPSTLAVYALAANRAREFLASTRAVRFVRRAAAGMMVGVAIAVAAR